jgi:hypothetical protein
MPIEILWLIPVFAAALLLPIVFLTAGKKDRKSTIGKFVPDLVREVEKFNEGGLLRESGRAEKRLTEIEMTINRVSDVLSSQQKIIQDVVGKDAGRESGLADLKEKLRELQNEYDIVISENYSLRSRLKKVLDSRNIAESAGHGDSSSMDQILGPGETRIKDKQVNMQLYDDTRTFSQAELNGNL